MYIYIGFYMIHFIVCHLGKISVKEESKKLMLVPS